jgi:hypothetical protein
LDYRRLASTALGSLVPTRDLLQKSAAALRSLHLDRESDYDANPEPLINRPNCYFLRKKIKMSRFGPLGLEEDERN